MVTNIKDFKKYILKESFKYNFTSEQEQELMFLVHGKEHITERTSKINALEKALKDYKEISSKPLYRGCSDEELNMILSKNPVNYYLSFSEDINIAKKFGKNIITLQNGKGFCYYKYVIKYYRNMDLDLYEIVDGDSMVQALKTELEWILPINSKFDIIDKDNLIIKQI